MSAGTAPGEFFVPDVSGFPAGIAFSYQGDSAISEHSRAALPSNLVLDATAVSWGISPEECRRLWNAGQFMKHQGKGLWWISTDTGISDARDYVDHVTRHIVKLQKRNGLPQYWFRVWETDPGIHAHIVFTGTRRIADALKASQLGEYADVDHVYDVEGLIRRYLDKERTPQADHALRGHFRCRRKKGSHQLAGGGDRVILSAALKADAIAAGYVNPWQRSNAKRTQERKQYRPRPLTARTLRPIGQLPLFPELERPPARLRDFHGGTMPPAPALELEFHRKQLGLTQGELGRRAGLSQPQIANVIQGRFGISPSAAARLKAVLADLKTQENAA